MGGKGEGGKSQSVSEWFLAIIEGASGHFLSIPFEVYEMLMEINKAHKQGRWKIRIGMDGGKRLTRR